MTTANTAPITGLGELRRRQQAAKDRAEKRIASKDVREARARLLDAREAAMAADYEAVNQKATRPGELYRETLDLVPDNLLEELERTLPNLGTRQMADIVADVLRGRRRARQAADLVPSRQAAGKLTKAR